MLDKFKPEAVTIKETKEDLKLLTKKHYPMLDEIEVERMSQALLVKMYAMLCNNYIADEGWICVTRLKPNKESNPDDHYIIYNNSGRIQSNWSLNHSSSINKEEFGQALNDPEVDVIFTDMPEKELKFFSTKRTLKNVLWQFDFKGRNSYQKPSTVALTQTKDGKFVANITKTNGFKWQRIDLKSFVKIYDFLQTGEIPKEVRQTWYSERSDGDQDCPFYNLGVINRRYEKAPILPPEMFELINTQVMAEELANSIDMRMN